MSGPRRFTVRLAEGLNLGYELASPVSRAAAWLVDAAVLAAACALLAVFLNLIRFWGADAGAGAMIAAFFALNTCYGILMEWLDRGQTLGKRALGLRVLDVGGHPLNATQAVLRNLLRQVDCLPILYGLGGLVAAASPKGQRLGDIAAGTVVVRERRAPLPDWNLVAPGEFNSLRERRGLAARLRRACSPQEAELGLELLLRRDALEDRPRLRLFAAMAGRFREKAELPAALSGIWSDEQWVRAVVDVLYQAEQGEHSGGQHG